MSTVVRDRSRMDDSWLDAELESVTAVLAARFAGRWTEDEVRAVVLRTHARLAAGARLTAHLIPLTANRAGAALEAGAASTIAGPDPDLVGGAARPGPRVVTSRGPSR